MEEELSENQKARVNWRTRWRGYHSMAVEVSFSSGWIVFYLSDWAAQDTFYLHNTTRGVMVLIMLIKNETLLSFQMKHFCCFIFLVVCFLSGNWFIAQLYIYICGSLFGLWMIWWLMWCSHIFSLFCMFHSQFGFYDDNETVVEMQQQDVSKNQTSDN